MLANFLQIENFHFNISLHTKILNFSKYRSFQGPQLYFQTTSTEQCCHRQAFNFDPET